MISPHSESIEKSKTKRKQEMLELQQLGVKLCGLSEPVLHSFNLPDNLLRAILEAKRLKSNGAMRRQAQYIGKIMRQIDSAPVFKAYLQTQSKQQQANAQFHQLEQWRDRLIAEEPTALSEFLSHYPKANPSQLRQLITNAVTDRINKRNTGASRRLLQFLKPFIL